MKTLFFSLAVAAALSACATVPAPAAAPKAFVTRHFEKESGSDPALTAQGQARAEALAGRLAGERIVAVFATDTQRARQSASPTAQRFGLEVQPYAPTDYAALAARVAAAGGSVLIVGHSNTAPEIVANLSGAPQPPMADERYGDLFVVDLVTKAVAAERTGD